MFNDRPENLRQLVSAAVYISAADAQAGYDAILQQNPGAHIPNFGHFDFRVLYRGAWYILRVGFVADHADRIHISDPEQQIDALTESVLIRDDAWRLNIHRPMHSCLLKEILKAFEKK